MHFLILFLIMLPIMWYWHDTREKKYKEYREREDALEFYKNYLKEKDDNI